MFSINCLLNIVTLAPVSIKNTKHLFCSLAFTKRPSLLAQVSLVFIAWGLLEDVWLWPPSATSIGFPGSLYFGHNSY
jgi:hypothetical protein